jgi:flagellar motor switch protein FliN/FliY
MDPEEIEGELAEEAESEASTPEEPQAPSIELAPVAEEVSLEPLIGDLVAAGGEDGDLSRVLDVPVELTVEMGRASMTIRETLAIGTGSIVTLNRLVGEPVDLFANGRLIARGEVIAVDEEYGLRVTEVLATAQRHAA